MTTLGARVIQVQTELRDLGIAEDVKAAMRERARRERPEDGSDWERLYQSAPPHPADVTDDIELQRELWARYLAKRTES